MSDIGGRSSHPSPTVPDAAEHATASSWRNVFRRVIQQSRWTRKRQEKQNLTPASEQISAPSWSNRKRWIAAAILLVAVLLLIATVRFIFSPSSVRQGTAKVVSSGSSLLGITPATKKLKPSPAKPMVKDTPQAQLPPSPWISAPPSPPIQFNTPRPQVQRGAPATSTPAPALAPNPIPAQPTTAARPPMAPLAYRARHDKHFGGSCLGQLMLNSAGMVFDCPNNPGESFQVALNEIEAVDDNGIRLHSGKKYHFSISGMSKNAEESLFANWLHQVR